MNQQKPSGAITRRVIDLTEADLVALVDARLEANLMALTPSERADDLMDRSTCAKFLGVSVAQLDKLMREQKLPFHRVGDVKRFDRSEVLLWVKRTA